jgi:hypothetical protein
VADLYVFGKECNAAEGDISLQCLADDVELGKVVLVVLKGWERVDSVCHLFRWENSCQPGFGGFGSVRVEDLEDV